MVKKWIAAGILAIIANPLWASQPIMDGDYICLLDDRYLMDFRSGGSVYRPDYSTLFKIKISDDGAKAEVSSRWNPIQNFDVNLTQVNDDGETAVYLDDNSEGILFFKGYEFVLTQRIVSRFSDAEGIITIMGPCENPDMATQEFGTEGSYLDRGRKDSF